MRFAQLLEIHAFPKLQARYPIIFGLVTLILSTGYGVGYGFPGQDMEIEAVYDFYRTWHIAWCFMRIGMLFMTAGFIFACFRSAPIKKPKMKTEPNNAIEGMRLLVTASAFALPAPSNRIPHLER